MRLILSLMLSRGELSRGELSRGELPELPPVPVRRTRAAMPFAHENLLFGVATPAASLAGAAVPLAFASVSIIFAISSVLTKSASTVIFAATSVRISSESRRSVLRNVERPPPTAIGRGDPSLLDDPPSGVTAPRDPGLLELLFSCGFRIEAILPRIEISEPGVCKKNGGRKKW